MPRARHPWAEAGSDDFEYLDTVHGRKGMNLEVDQGEYDPCADDGEGEGEINAQDWFSPVRYDEDDFRGA